MPGFRRFGKDTDTLITGLETFDSGGVRHFRCRLGKMSHDTDNWLTARQ